MKFICGPFFCNVNMAISYYVPRGIWAIYLTPVEKAVRVLDVSFKNNSSVCEREDSSCGYNMPIGKRESFREQQQQNMELRQTTKWRNNYVHPPRATLPEVLAYRRARNYKLPQFVVLNDIIIGGMRRTLV